MQDMQLSTYEGFMGVREERHKDFKLPVRMEQGCCAEHHRSADRGTIVRFSYQEKWCFAPSALVSVFGPMISLKENIGGSVMKLMLPGSDTHRQESVFIVVGVLKEYDLPPVERSKISAYRVKYDLTYQIVTSFPEGRAESWLPNPISDDYGRSRPVIKDPAGFRAGDVVELGFAIIAYRVIQKDTPEKYVCRLVMQTLTLLDTSLAKGAYIQQSAQVAAPSKQSQRATFANNPVAKRRKMFEEEDSDSDVPETNKRMDDMHITRPNV
ncbi:hypothetical protein B0H11DRAFT_1941894 [Mycena galericulata]|nr:hypothetical protein B0H11DRAFT_1941894 [Mycena galericulata]